MAQPNPRRSPDERTGSSVRAKLAVYKLRARQQGVFHDLSEVPGVEAMTPKEAIKQAAGSDTLVTNVVNHASWGWAEAYGDSGTHYVYTHKDRQVRRYSPQVEAPAPVSKVFSVWNGNTMHHQTVRAVAEAVKALSPDQAWGLEWFPKAGEGGTWQSAWDSSPLAISGPAHLSDLAAEMRIEHGIRLVPYVVIRGRPEWREAEMEQIRQCVLAAGMCILNLEPGSDYWNGPTDVGGVHHWFTSLDVAEDKLWLCAIPRQSAVNELGGDDVMRVWASEGNVAGVSWECYEDAPAPDLAPGGALERAKAWVAVRNYEWGLIPVIQRSMIDRYKDWPSPSIQVWTLDGN